MVYAWCIVAAKVRDARNLIAGKGRRRVVEMTSGHKVAMQM
jgi:hypothetical protein